MNKQAITFLSLFSLILVLSVYYMLLPEQEVHVSDTLSSVEKLQSELDQRREEIEIKNQQIIASETSTTESIKIALKTMKDNEKASETEKTVNEKVKELGYSEVFSELNGNIINVTVVKENASETDASKIISTLLQHFNSEFQVQVKFIQ